MLLYVIISYICIKMVIKLYWVMDMEEKLKLKTSLTERVSDIIVERLNRSLNKEGLELIKMRLGIQIVLINLTKFIVIFFIAAQFNLLKEAIFMSLVLGSVRRSSFGIHSNNSIVCTIITSIVFLFGPYLSYNLELNNYFVFIIFLVINLLLFKYAPADTEKHPLLGKKLRSKLKRQSVTTGIFLMILTLAIPIQSIKIMIVISVSAQVVSLLPITYKILNRGYKNYEKYERTNI